MYSDNTRPENPPSRSTMPTSSSSMPTSQGMPKQYPLNNAAPGLSTLGLCLPRPVPTYFAIVVLGQDLRYVALAGLELAT